MQDKITLLMKASLQMNYLLCELRTKDICDIYELTGVSYYESLRRSMDLVVQASAQLEAKLIEVKYNRLKEK
jgi:hypothetical protein